MAPQGVGSDSAGNVEREGEGGEEGHSFCQ